MAPLRGAIGVFGWRWFVSQYYLWRDARQQRNQYFFGVGLLQLLKSTPSVYQTSFEGPHPTHLVRRVRLSVCLTGMVGCITAPS